MTPEQKWKLEQAKNQTPSTNAFILWIPAFVFLAWLCKSELPMETHYVKQQFTHSHNSDPVCDGETWCILGWKL